MNQTRFFSPPLSLATANPKSVFQFDRVRFTLLTERLIRIESSTLGDFEDRPSQVFWYRNQPIPVARIENTKNNLLIETEVFRLIYQDSPKGLTQDSLHFQVKENGCEFSVDDVNRGALPGTIRTLDETNGPVHLQPGLISRLGWVQIDDSSSLVFNSSGWIEPRKVQKDYRDLYFLISGSDYKSALKDFQKVSGKPTLLPRAFLGNWWSRYWEYSQKDVENLVKRFEKEEIPLSVFIIDMDWHITKTGNSCSGWTGFSWNRSLFPDPPGLINWLHTQNLSCSLNLHPAEGIHPHEESYRCVCKALGLNSEEGKPVTFDIADPDFTRVYFDNVLSPIEDQGIDFWWLDWQQGDKSKLHGLDPLWWLNHLHYYDLARNPAKRPVIFSRWGGLGNQRYPIGFSGDTVVSWKSLAFQPHFTASAANVGYGWWSHDIGGHMRGMEDSELYTRWVQFGVLSPIFRLHCTKDPFIEREPWAYDAETLKLVRELMQFRHALIPYLYTMARRNEQEGLTLVTPLYYDWPNEDSSYLNDGQYLFGSELMAAPITSPIDRDLNMSRKAIWFPPGEWFNFFTGQCFVGPQWRIGYFGLEEVPLFAKAGAIIPLLVETKQNGCVAPKDLDIIVFPGRNGSFNLYEDDGSSQQYLKDGGCITKFKSFYTEISIRLQISPVVGDSTLIPKGRTFRIFFRGVDHPNRITLTINGEKVNLPFSYDVTALTAAVGPIDLSPEHALNIEMYSRESSILECEPSPSVNIVRLLKRARMETVTKWKINSMIGQLRKDIKGLGDPDLRLTSNHLLALIETITGAGAIETQHPQYGDHIVLANPYQLVGFKCKSQKNIELDSKGIVLSEMGNSFLVDYFGLLRKSFIK